MTIIWSVVIQLLKQYLVTLLLVQPKECDEGKGIAPTDKGYGVFLDFASAINDMENLKHINVVFTVLQ